MQPAEVLARRAENTAAPTSESHEVPTPVASGEDSGLLIPQAPEPAAASPSPDGEEAPAEAHEGTLLTLAQAARTVGLSERALRKHIGRGKLVSQRIVRNGRDIAAVTVGALRAAYGSLEMVPTPGDRADETKLQSARELKQAEALKRQRARHRDAEARLARLRALLGMERTEKRELRRQMRFLAETLSRSEARLESAQAEIQALSLELGRARGQAEALERAAERSSASS